MSEVDKTKQTSLQTTLTRNQEHFCWLYANPPPLGAATAVDAYVRAFHYNKQRGNAAKCASHLLTLPTVQQRIAEIRELNAERSEVKAERVIAEIAKIAFAKITDYIRWDANGKLEVIPSAELTDDQAAAIREFFGRDNWQGHRVRLHDKIDALDRLAKYLGLFTDKVDVTSGGKPIASLTNDERCDRIVAIVESARTRRTLSPGDELEE